MQNSFINTRKCLTLFVLCALSFSMATPRSRARVQSQARSAGASPSFEPAAGPVSETEPNDTPSQAMMLDLINSRAAVTGALSSGNDMDHFKFTAPAGAKVWAYVDTGGAQNQGAATRDSTLTLLTADGAVTLEVDDDDGTGNGCDDSIETGLSSAIAGRTLVSAGTYLLLVQDFGRGILSPYTLYVVMTTASATAESEPNNASTDANTIASNSTAGIRSGTTSSSDPDWYSVAASSGAVLYLAVDGDPERDGSTNTFLEFLSPNGTLLLSSSSASSNPFAEAFCFAITTSGTYFVRVRGAASSPGTYQLMVSVNATEVRIAAGTPAPGAISVPIEMVSQGNENAIGFSLTFDQNVLTNPQVSLGADASAATLNPNASQAAQGRLGILLALPAGQKFSAGSRQLVTVAFTLAPNATAFSATIGFGDQPIAREIADVNASPVPAIFTPATITIQGYEADVAPRPNGNNNGQVTVTDWTQVGRFVAGLDTASAGSEYQRADCAPRNSLGDGRLTASDYTQAGRYAAGLDPVVAAGGPTVPPAATLAAAVDAEPRRPAMNDRGDEARLLRAIDESSSSGTHSFAFDLEARGGENAIGFSLSFDPRQWRFASATAGADAGEASIVVNDDEAASGRVGIVIALPAGQTLMAGARRIVILNFDLPSGNRDGHRPRAASIEFSDYPVAREVADAEANALPAIFDFGRQSSKERRP